MTANIPECPAYGACRERGIACDVCTELDAEDWKKHVRKVLKRATKGR
jgi:hypothetical protein